LISLPFPSNLYILFNSKAIKQFHQLILICSSDRRNCEAKKATTDTESKGKEKQGKEKQE
jgi:hypothetical protein